MGVFCLPVLLFLCVVYFLAFAADMDRYDATGGFWQYALNSHDHFIYVESMDRVREGDFPYEFSNDLGIAAIYVVLAKVFPFLVDQDFTVISLLFNSVILICSYLVYASICDLLELTVLALLFAVHSGLRGTLYRLILLVPILLLVRQQLAVFALVFVLLMRTAHPWRRIVPVYLVTSLVAGVLSVFTAIIGWESLGEGFSMFLVDFNQRFYVGYLIFNPLRALQYLVDAFSSFSFWTDTGGVDVAKILRIPQLLLLVALAPPIISMIKRFNYWLTTPAKSLVLVVVSFFLVWLMNPTINARYTMLITPVLVLFGLYARRHVKQAAV